MKFGRFYLRKGLEQFRIEYLNSFHTSQYVFKVSSLRTSISLISHDRGWKLSATIHLTFLSDSILKIFSHHPKNRQGSKLASFEKGEGVKLFAFQKRTHRVSSLINARCPPETCCKLRGTTLFRLTKLAFLCFGFGRRKSESSSRKLTLTNRKSIASFSLRDKWSLIPNTSTLKS